MTDFAFRVEGDASQADKAIEGVLAHLDRVEVEARQAGNALSSSFSSASAAISKVSSEVRQMGNAVAMQRAQTQQAMATINLPNAPKAAGFDFKGIAGMGAAALGAAGVAGGAVAAIDHVIERHHQLADSYTELSNKAVKFTTDTKSSSDVIREQADLASKLNTTSAGIIDTFDAVADSTERLNLSTTKQLRLTELLGKGALLGGKSVQSVGDRMNALSSAFETGADAGRQIRALFRDFHDLGNSVSEAMGLTKEQIVDMAGDGRLSFEQLVEGIIKGGGAIDTSFNKIKETHKSATDQFQEGFNNAMQSGKGFYEAIISGADQAEGRILTTTDLIKRLADDTARSLEKIQRSQMGTGSIFGVDQTSAAIAGFDKIAASGQAFSPAQLRAGDMLSARRAEVAAARAELDALDLAKDGIANYAEKRKQLIAIIEGTTGAVQKEKKEHIDIAKIVRDGAAAWDALHAAKMRAQNEFADPSGLAQQAEREREVLAIMREVETPMEKYLQRIERLKILQDEGSISAHLFFQAQQKAWKETFGEAEKARSEELTKSWQERMKAMEESNKQFASSFAPIGDAIRDAFAKGELSAQSFGSVLQQISFNLFKFMALQAAASLIQGGGSGGMLGSVIQGVFGAAHGGVIYSGTGGTDSQLVAFRKSPNEHMTTLVETPEQFSARMAGSNGSAQPAQNLNFFQKNDEREITSAFRGSSGATVIALQARKWRKRNR